MTCRFSSVLLASILISACGGGGDGGGDGDGESTSLSDVQPVVKHFSPTSNPVRLDTVIASNQYHLFSDNRSIIKRKNCSGLVCKDESGQIADITSEANSGFGMLEANGRVNGPEKRNVTLENKIDSAPIGNMISYVYWMGSSIFYTLNSNMFNPKYPSVGYYYQQAAIAMGDNTGSRPSGNTTYTGKAVAISTDDFEDYEQEDLEKGDFSLTYDLNNASVEIDLKFEDWDHTFDPVNVSSDGSFSGNSNGEIVRGAFFGSGHKEVALTYEIPEKSVVGAFGGIKD